MSTEHDRRSFFFFFAPEVSYESPDFGLSLSWAILLSWVDLFVFGLLFFFCLSPLRRCQMPRRGLVAAPDGWVQIIRGPCSPSVKWPAASEGSGTTKKHGVVGVEVSGTRAMASTICTSLFR